MLCFSFVEERGSIGGMWEEEGALGTADFIRPFLF